MSKLKTLKSLYHTNVQTHNVPSNDSPYHIKKAKISKKKYKKAYRLRRKAPTSRKAWDERSES